MSSKLPFTITCFVVTFLIQEGYSYLKFSLRFDNSTQAPRRFSKVDYLHSEHHGEHGMTSKLVKSDLRDQEKETS